MKAVAVTRTSPKRVAMSSEVTRRPSMLTLRMMAPVRGVTPALRIDFSIQRPSATSLYMPFHITPPMTSSRSPVAFRSWMISSAMPWVSWRPFGPGVNRPQNMPMIELTAWPPRVGRPSTRITLRPARAASIAADTPEAPDPTTQMSQPRSSTGAAAPRETMRVSGSNGRSSMKPPPGCR